MRILLDACVLYPTVMREILLGVAAKGLFTPLWSARILEEWARAVARNHPDQAATARVEIALLKAHWPRAMTVFDPETLPLLHLPDVDDRHVLAAAISGQADVLMTLNTKDFPSRTLAGHGLLRRDPDGLLRELFEENPEALRAVCTQVHTQAIRLSGPPQPLRPFLKKARLPRLAKALVGTAAL